jgi:hypothetical protein
MGATEDQDETLFRIQDERLIIGQGVRNDVPLDLPEELRVGFFKRRLSGDLPVQEDSFFHPGKISIQDETGPQEFKVAPFVNHPGKAPGFPIAFFPHRHAVQEEIRMNMHNHPASQIEDMGEPPRYGRCAHGSEKFFSPFSILY